MVQVQIWLKGHPEILTFTADYAKAETSSQPSRLGALTTLDTVNTNPRLEYLEPTAVLAITVEELSS